MCKYLCRVKINYQLKDINNAANQFWNAVKDKKVFAFHGNMGAGKTTFILALCEMKGVKEVMSSPTFSIINEYFFTSNSGTGKIYHIDLYRLKDEEEAIRAGVEDCFYSDHICFIEWPEKAPGILPAATLHVFIELSDTQTSSLTLQE
jgi:tRNA threonylcarbamoyladenosine biosynthesis protein TsaE